MADIAIIGGGPSGHVEPARQAQSSGTGSRSNRLRALLLSGDDTARDLARGTLKIATLAELARRRPPGDTTQERAVRHAEIRRLGACGPVSRQCGRTHTVTDSDELTFVERLTGPA
jgi:hypothetical protein